MVEEIYALIQNGTWTLVEPTPKMNIIGCKWVFHMKLKVDSSLECRQACLATKGFHQVERQDYTETFSPVVNPTTIQTILTLVASRGWSIKQLDVHNAFLNGILWEAVFMKQPAGFIDSACPNSVCKLNKSQYGLKQASRAWFASLSYFLLQRGFNAQKTDHSLFIYNKDGIKIFILIYVDNILITGNSTGHIWSLITLVN